jgi:hypothetical protein
MYKQLALVSGLVLLAFQPVGQPTPPTDAPTYAKDGSLMAPADYRMWVYLTSGLDMSYAAQTPGAPPPSHSVFDNVFVNPTSYRSFLTTGTWPDKTTFVLEIRGAENPVSINKRGHTQSQEVHAEEIHVKDNGKWSFYELNPDGKTAKYVPATESCYTCHEAHGAVDTTFVQFYPTLMPLATEKKTLSANYLKDSAAPTVSEPTKTPATK